jgi:hypothetical protein
MNAHQMICHLGDALASASGPSPKPGTGWLSRFPWKHLAIYFLPWPKNKLQSPPDLLLTTPTDWAQDLDRLAGLLDSVAGRDTHGDWPVSEVFGKLSGRDCGSLLWAHINHHFTQFGI